MEDILTAVREQARKLGRAASEALPAAVEACRVQSLHHVRARHYKAVGVGDLAPHEIERAVQSPQALLEDSEAIVVKRGRSSLIVQTSLRVAGCRTRAACKRFGSRSRLQQVARAFLPPGSVRSFRLGHELLRRGVATPRPLLAVSPRWRAFLSPNFLATEWLEGAVPIDAFLVVTAGLEPARQRPLLRETADRVGWLVGTLHARGFAHRDLKATNLLVRERCGRVEIFIIDLDGASAPWFLTRRTRIRNLARLVVASQGSSEVTHALRRRALGAYLAAVGDATPWKAVWRQLEEISRIRRSRRALPNR